MATSDDVKADTVDMEQIQIHPTVTVDADGNAHLITEGIRGDGANRLGGNAVADIIVFGRIAGDSAVAYIG